MKLIRFKQWIQLNHQETTRLKLVLMEIVDPVSDEITSLTMYSLP